jgi:hypothetical protein
MVLLSRSGFIRFLWLGFLLACLLTGCDLEEGLALPSAVPVTPSPAPGSWQTLRTGLERRRLDALNEQGLRVDTLTILRIDPKFFTFKVAYHPKPLTLEAWQAETGALIVINGGYFWQKDELYYPTGLAVIDGKPIGASYDSFAGMLAISKAGPELRWLAQKPYSAKEALLSGLQSFPLLVKPGGELGFPVEKEDLQQDRRTVIAQDKKGRFLLIIAPRGGFTLHRLSAYLAASDMELNIALNLDGGPSTGLLLAEPAETIAAYGPLPVVIAITPR